MTRAPDLTRAELTLAADRYVRRGPVAVDFPLRLDAADQTATTADQAAVAEQLIEELLFTSPGERLNRPQLGCGVRQLVFAAATPELQAAVCFQVKAQLQRWLGDVVTVQTVAASATGSQLRVDVGYVLAGSAMPRAVSFHR